MTKIALMLWAVDFMYGVGWILVAIGILAVIAFIAFSLTAGMCWCSFKEYGDPVVSLASRMKNIAKMFSDALPVLRPGLTTMAFRPMLTKLSLQSRRWHWTKNLPSSSIHQTP